MLVLSLIVGTLFAGPTKHGSAASLIVAGARKQLIRPALYTPGYFSIGYPNGDLPPNQGVCTDVVIRSFRNAGIDLQSLIHEDMKRHFSSYPRREKRPDSNIDHRRVPNLATFFTRYGIRLPTTVNPHTLSTWMPGDVVMWILPNGRDHCAVISNRRNARGIPLVIHNMQQTSEEDVLTTFQIVGHYRYPKA